MKYEPLKKIYYTNENGYELEYSITCQGKHIPLFFRLYPPVLRW